MRVIKYVVYLLITGIGLAGIFIWKKKAELDTSQVIFHYDINNDNIKTHLVGKYCKSISSFNTINTDIIGQKGAIIFLYNGFDCEDCINIGFNMINTINKSSNQRLVYVVASMTNIGNDQQKYSFYSYIQNDHDDIIRKELKFIPTPLFICLDTSCKIVNSYQPYVSDIKGQKRFIEYIIKQ